MVEQEQLGLSEGLSSLHQPLMPAFDDILLGSKMLSKYLAIILILLTLLSKIRVLDPDD